MRAPGTGQKKSERKKGETKMETAAAVEPRARAARLEKQISELQAKRKATEGRLDQEHQLIKRAAGERSIIVESLSHVEGDAARQAHAKIDGIDRVIRSSERLAEGLQKNLERAAQEIEALTSELAEIQRSIAAQENEVAYRKWEAEMVREFRAASESLDGARVALANLQAVAVRGNEQFSGRAASLLTNLFADFIRTEANPELRFTPARPIHEMTRFAIWPMLPKAASAAGR
jgi:chromosome segregation ATPase